MRPETLIRLYPRAWRERYGAELLALLEATPMTSGVRADLLRGAAREWVEQVVRPGDTACPYPLLLVRQVVRLAGLTALSWCLVLAAWPLAEWLHVNGFVMPGNARGLLLGMLVSARGSLALFVGMQRGHSVWAVGRGEFVIWVGVAFVGAVAHILDPLELRQLPWNRGMNSALEQSDLVLYVFNWLAMTVLGSRGAARDAQLAEAWRSRKRAMKVPSSPLGLRD
jgi:hypothetical protein